LHDGGYTRQASFDTACLRKPAQDEVIYFSETYINFMLSSRR
jgi:hypothetical protein